MRIIFINEFKEVHNNDYLAYVKPVLESAGAHVDVVDDRILDDTSSISELNTYNKVISTCHEAKHMLKWDGKIEFEHICVNHSYGGPTNFNEHPLTIFNRFQKSRDKLFLQLPEFYQSLFGHKYDKQVILTKSYFKLLKLFDDSDKAKIINTNDNCIYFAHWTTNLNTVLDICNKYSKLFPNRFKVRLHPLYFSTARENNDLLLKMHNITQEAFMTFYSKLLGTCEIDSTINLVDSICNASHYVFDGMSNTITEAVTVNAYLKQTSKKYAFENNNQVLEWSTQYDREIALKYFYSVNPDYSIGTFTELDNLWDKLNFNLDLNVIHKDIQLELLG